jgi:hypothetical protein
MMLWVASLVAALPIPLLYILTPLRENEPGGHDIASFELAGSVERANEILGTWRAVGVERMAKYLQLFDVVYPVLYAVALAGCAIAAGHALRRVGAARAAGLAPAVAWIAFAAAVFDYVENIGLDTADARSKKDHRVVASAARSLAAGVHRRRGAQVLLHSRDDRVRVGRSRGVDETGIRRRLSRCLCFPEGVGIGERNQQV